MAEYYPLLARAVASLPNSTTESRRAIYERARKALLTQLQSTQPPVPQADIERETRALDEAAARIEAEKLRGAPPPPPDFRTPPPLRPSAPAASTGSGAWPPPPKLTLPSASVPAAAPAPTAAPERAPDARTADPAWKRFGQPRLPEAPAAGRDEQPYPQPVAEPLRPGAPAPKVEGARNPRGLIVAAVCLVLFAVVGALAWRLRDTPAELARPQGAQAASETAEAPPAPKIQGRVDAGPAQAPAQQTAAATAARSPSAANPAELALGRRAALLIEAPEEQQRVKTYFGVVDWTLDRASPDALPVLRAEVDIADAKLKATVTISRNADPKSPAAHMITVRFSPQLDGPVAAVGEIEAPSMRIEDQRVGDPLDGLPLQVTPNYFFVGLLRDDVKTARNLDLIKNRGWFDVPMKLTSGRIAKLTFEKGPTGEQLLAEALAAWN